MPAGDNGVPSLASDGTPVCLDPAMSVDALAALEFADALDVVASFSAGPLGASALRARVPTDDLGWIRRELALVGEALVVLRRGTAIDVAPTPDVRGALGRLRMTGSVLEVSELAAIKAALVAGRRNVELLEALAESCPGLSGLRVPPIDRATERMLELAIGDDEELLDSASPALASARREVHAARERLVRRLDSMLRDFDASTVPSGASVTMRGGRYVIPVRRDSRTRPPASFTTNPAARARCSSSRPRPSSWAMRCDRR